jgi:SAM-dependent methyltransferase
MRKQWVEFFRHEAGRYLEHGFTKNTIAEVDFIERELVTRPGQSIVDVGCGTGRHSLELARRGFRCAGIDQSPEMLAVARNAAEAGGLRIDFIEGDASTVRLDRRFDHAICLCEGAFSLVEQGIDPVRYHRLILANIAGMLKPRGKFLLTALNGYRLAREHSDADVSAGHFDPASLSHSEDIEASDGVKARVVEKGFTPAELRLLLEDAGFRVLSVWGGTAGCWDKSALHLDEIELMVLSERL